MTELELERKLTWILSHPNGTYGERCNAHKLTNEQVLEVKSMYRGGFTVYVIAEKFNVHHETIRAIVKGRSWKHMK